MPRGKVKTASRAPDRKVASKVGEKIRPHARVFSIAASAAAQDACQGDYEGILEFLEKGKVSLRKAWLGSASE